MSDTTFLQKTQFELLEHLTADAKPQWGIMGAQNMVEHLSSSYLMAIEKVKSFTFYEEEKLQRNYNYLIRDKQPFRRNIKLKGLEKPLPLRFESLNAAIAKYKDMVDKFYLFFEQNQHKQTVHPACGLLNFEEWKYIQAAHARHHFIQFNLIPDEN